METIKKQKLDQLHFEHNLWKSQLAFYKDELQLYVKRLEEIASKNTGPEIGAMIEHFQNNFIRQVEVIDTLRHDIKAHEKELAAEVSKNPIASDHRLYNGHEDLGNQMVSFVKIYSELKEEFSRFVADKL